LTNFYWPTNLQALFMLFNRQLVN